MTNDAPLVIDVSADERFYLTLDGKFIARGPNRGTVENWQYQTYSIDNLKMGEHTLEAIVWRFGSASPLAQMTWRGGFVLKADGVYDAQLTTGKAEWQVGEINNVVHPVGPNGTIGVGDQFEIWGRGPYAVEPKSYVKAQAIRGPAGANYKGCGFYSLRADGWMLYPSEIPDQMARVVQPGRFRGASTNAPWRSNHTYTEAETKSAWVAPFNELLKNGKAVTIPPKTRLQLAWDLDCYICAYPELLTKGGKGARVSWTWTESTRDEKTKHKNQRDALVGKYLDGFGDVFVPDGKDGAFSAPWWRCGRWCRLDIETKDEPLTLTRLALIESRYPIELESTFVSPQDSSFQDIRRICARVLQMCAHEMFFDCPFYEQQMYAGDTRVQLLVMAAMARDDRLIRRAIEIFELSTRDNGMCPMNWPSRLLQEGSSYTLCYLLMYDDYLMNHANREWLRARLSGLRKSLTAFEYYEREDGLLAGLPGWHFMDWSPQWYYGIPPGGMDTKNGGVMCEMNLFWLLTLQMAEKVEREFGNDDLAAHWHKKAEKLKSSIIKTFWHEQRGMLADNIEKYSFSEHTLSLAIIADALPKDKAERAFKNLVEDKTIARCTVYFSYYLFEAYFKMGRADLFLKRLDMWRDYVKKGVTTVLECPETEKSSARSDCHAWGAHPIWFMQTGLAGIKSAAPFFAKVRVAPQPGHLKEIQATHPHPKGWIKVDLTFNGNTATGTIDTPVEGSFEYGGKIIPLKVGVNKIPLP